MKHRKKRKKERKHIEKREKKKRGIKTKAQKVSSNNGEVNVLRGEKHFNLKIFFLM
jgi:hypothetical protein